MLILFHAIACYLLDLIGYPPFQTIFMHVRLSLQTYLAGSTTFLPMPLRYFYVP